MVGQYPHKLVIELPASQPTLANGEWVFGSTTTVTLECRAEPNSGNRTIPSQTGSLVVFEFSIYLPLMDTEIPFDAKCTLTISPTRVIVSKCKRHENGQLNSRIWL